MPKVSILTPCFNVKEEWLTQCLDSLRNQTLKDIELICIDDGSTDDTGARLDAYAKLDSRVTVIHKENSGYGDSMNVGLARCKGQYVGIVEPDDWVELTMFETLYRAAEDNDLDLVRCCHYESRMGKPEVAVTDDWVQKNVVLSPLEHKEVFLQSPAIWTSLVKRRLLEENDIHFLPTPGASFQDMSYGVKMKVCAKRFMLLDLCLHHYRIHEGSSVSSVLSEQKAFCVCKEWEEIYDFVFRRKEVFKVLRDDLAIMEKGCYVWNLERLKGELRYRFVKKWQSELLSRIDEGQVSLGDLSYDEREYLEEIAYDADDWFERTYPHEHAILDGEGFKGLISVIVTMYKNEDTIRATVRSVLSQSYDNIEVVCVDDCSPDGCWEIVKELAEHDGRIKLVKRTENGGLSACRNSGLDVAHGEAVTFVDGDDKLLPNALSSMARRFNDQTDAVFSTVKIEYCGGASLYGHYPESDAVYYSLPGNDTRRISRHEILKYHCSASAKLFRLANIQKAKIRFPEGLLFEDALFTWSYFALFNNRVAFCRNPVYLYRRRRSSIMTNLLDKPENRSIQHMEILRRYLDFLNDRNLIRDYTCQLPSLVESNFWFSFTQCAKWEKVVAVSHLASLLHQFSIVCATPTLQKVYDGDVGFLLVSEDSSKSVEGSSVVLPDSRLNHRLVRLALGIDSWTRKVFPPGNTRARRIAKRIWSVCAQVRRGFSHG